MTEKQVGEKLGKHSPRFLWKPCSDKYGYGTPDRCVGERGTTRVLWVELKHIGRLPKWKAKVPGFKSRQAIWLNEWERNGGECYLAIGVGSDDIAFFDTGFVDICRYGLERQQYNLMKYNQVERWLLERAWKKEKSSQR